jgi:hypothetical protein
MLKNVSKSGLKIDASKRGDTSSRSNSIRKTGIEKNVIK